MVLFRKSGRDRSRGTDAETVSRESRSRAEGGNPDFCVFPIFAWSGAYKKIRIFWADYPILPAPEVEKITQFHKNTTLPHTTKFHIALNFTVAHLRRSAVAG